MRLTIIFPTYNRSKLLLEALKSIAPQCRRADGNIVELLIVDNNSQDDTKKSVLVFSGGNPDICLKYTFEPKQGLSWARNRGISEARGDIVAFADDDIEFAEGWVNACFSHFMNKAVGDIIGGPVVPYRSKVPSWIPSNKHYLVGIWSFEGKSCEVTNVIGCNFCARREVLEAVGTFDTQMGRKGDLLLMGEENDYFLRSRKMGYKIVAIPEMIVYHKVEPKYSVDYVCQNAIASGAGLAQYDKAGRGSIYRHFKIIYYNIMLAMELILVWLTTDNKKTLHKINIKFYSGYKRGVRISNGRII